MPSIYCSSITKWTHSGAICTFTIIVFLFFDQYPLTHRPCSYLAAFMLILSGTHAPVLRRNYHIKTDQT